MKSLDAFDKQFPSEEACRQYLVEKRWPEGVRCPRCGAAEKVYALKARPFHWACKNTDCGGRSGYRFSVITGTIFQDTKVPLKLWFKVGYLMLTAKKGISALQVHRVIFGEESGSDWRTSWYMCHRWRAAMRGTVQNFEDGEIEIDETYIGGKDRNRHANKKSAAQREKAGYRKPGQRIGYAKVGVIGAIARKGNVVCKVIGDTDAETMRDFVKQTVSTKVSLVATDEKNTYKYVDRDLPHQWVNHSRGEYVRGNVHTNNLESFWALLKRGIVGTFHHVSKDYLPLYLNEFSFRHNNREVRDMFGLLMTTCS